MSRYHAFRIASLLALFLPSCGSSSEGTASVSGPGGPGQPPLGEAGGADESEGSNEAGSLDESDDPDGAHGNGELDASIADESEVGSLVPNTPVEMPPAMDPPACPEGLACQGTCLALGDSSDGCTVDWMDESPALLLVPFKDGAVIAFEHGFYHVRPGPDGPQSIAPLGDLEWVGGGIPGNDAIYFRATGAVDGVYSLEPASGEILLLSETEQGWAIRDMRLDSAGQTLYFSWVLGGSDTGLVAIDTVTSDETHWQAGHSRFDINASHLYYTASSALMSVPLDALEDPLAVRKVVTATGTITQLKATDEYVYYFTSAEGAPGALEYFRLALADGSSERLLELPSKMVMGRGRSEWLLSQSANEWLHTWTLSISGDEVRSVGAVATGGGVVWHAVTPSHVMFAVNSLEQRSAVLSLVR